MTPPQLSYVHHHEIHEAPGNPRSISPERYEALKHALRVAPDMLIPRPAIVELRNADIIAGNMRHRGIVDILDNEEDTLLHQRVKEWGGIPVYMREFSDAERREWMLRDNQGYGDYVPDELASIVAAHEAEGGDLSLLGFKTDELKDLIALANDEVPPEEPDAPEDDIKTTWGVVIECEDEAEQAELLDELTERGLNVRALIA